MNIVVGLADVSSRSVGSFNLSIDQLVRIAVPESFGAPEVAKVRRDCEILLERIKGHPEGFQDLVKLANSGDLSAVHALAKKLKLTEPDFAKEGGGCIFLLVCLGILVLAYIDRKNLAR
jgi:hypothetical protein